jgi:hypothetical protein
MKIVGVVIDCNLKGDMHLSKAGRNCNYSLSLLQPRRCLLSLESRKLLVTSLTLSNLYYVSCVWFNCSSKIGKLLTAKFKVLQGM